MDPNRRELSSRIFSQVNRLSIVADQLWVTNRETGNVNSAVASWCKDEIMEIITQLDIIGRVMASESMEKPVSRAEFPKFME